MTLSFKPITMVDQEPYRQYLSLCHEVTSDYCFANLWSWASAYGLDWAWTDQLIWLRQRQPNLSYWAPVGNWQKVDWSQYNQVLSNLDASIIRVPDQLAGIWASAFGETISVVEDRDQFDYIYKTEDLIALKGNRFHKKKNLVNQFKKKYDYQYVAMTPETVEKARALQDDWCTWRECDSNEQLANENQAIANVLSEWENLYGMLGGCIFVEDTVVAYTIGERISPDMLVIHFEKANTSYKGVYQAVNHMFLEHEASDVMWVNREQDLGDDGLRQAKASYHPARFLKKFRIDLKK
jgi:hypothetical protein